MKTISLVMKLALPAIAAAGCVPVHDYEGDYDMTYNMIMSPADAPRDVRAGLSKVEVNKGLSNDEFLVDLGATFCRLSGSIPLQMTIYHWPYLEIPPQDCWFAAAGTTYPLMVSGSATFGEHDERFTIVLTGTFSDEARKTFGSATLQFTESW